MVLNMSVVLIVEDNPVEAKLIRHLVSTILKNSEEIIVCNNIDDALSICTELTPDVILADVYLDNGNTGFDLKSKISDKSSPCRDIPFIFISSTPEISSTMIKVLTAGGISFLPKPLCKRMLKEDLELALRISDVQKEKCNIEQEITKIVNLDNCELE